MTIQKSCSENKKQCLNMSFKYGLGEFRRSWPKMVLYFVIFALVMVLPLLMSNVTELRYYGDMTTYEKALEYKSQNILDIMEEYSQIWGPLSMLVAIFAGCYVTKILNNRVSADFYHSTPLRRESIFLTRVIIGILTYLITFVLSVIIVMLICETTPLTEGYGALIFKQIMKNVGYALVSFLMMFSVTVFSGMLCGTTVMQLLMTAYFNLVVFVYYISTFLTLSRFLEVFNANWYFESEETVNIVPFARFFSIDFLEKIKTVDFCFFIIGSFLLLVASLALYKFRRIEKAGTPIVFDGFTAFFRYSVIIPATLLGGLFLYAFDSNDIWYYMGLILGAILSFMLLNTIIAKNARKMFVGIKGFGIYAAVMACVIALVGFDAFGLDGYIPNGDNIKSVEITLRNQLSEIKFEDRNVISAAIELDKHGRDIINLEEIETSQVYITSSEDAEKYALPLDVYTEEVDVVVDHSFYPRNRETYRYNVVYYPKFGLPIARAHYVQVDSEYLKALLKTVADSAEYEKQLLKQLDYIDDEGHYNPDYDFLTSMNYKEDPVTYDTSANQIASSLKENFKGVDYEHYQRTQIARMYLYGSYYRLNLDVPIFADDISASPYRRKLGVDEYFSVLSEEISQIVIHKGAAEMFTALSDGVIVIENKDMIKEILQNTSSLIYDESIFTETEPQYQIGILVRNENGDVRATLCTKFLADKVPEFVKNSFKQ